MQKSIEKSYQIEWPGWSLSDNKYGKEFDAEARIRMIETGRKLLPYLLDNSAIFGENFLEIGPFFTPILFSEELQNYLPKNHNINFLENDQNVINWLSEKFRCFIFKLNIDSTTFFHDLTQKMTAQFGSYKDFYDVVTMSQIVNYVDYKQLLTSLFPMLNKEGYIFLNNVVDYGIPILFSEQRPKSNQEIIDTAKAIGYKIYYKEEQPKMFDEEPNKRLILILSK